MPVLALITFSFAALLAGLIVGVLFNRRAFEARVDAEVADLFAEVETMPTYFDASELEGLPAPVRRFFERNLHQGQPHPSCLRARQEGSMRDKPGQPMTEFVGELYLVANPPGMLWFARLRPLPLVWIDSCQVYLRGRAQVRSKLLSSLSTVDAKDDGTRRATAVQYLAELALLPPALLPGDHLRWEAVDDERARVILRDGELEVSGVFAFDELGNIVGFSSEDRVHSDRPDASWRVRYGEHRAFGELQLPTMFEVEWHTPETVFASASWQIMVVEVDVPRRWTSGAKAA